MPEVLLVRPVMQLVVRGKSQLCYQCSKALPHRGPILIGFELAQHMRHTRPRCSRTKLQINQV